MSYYRDLVDIVDKIGVTTIKGDIGIHDIAVIVVDIQFRRSSVVDVGKRIAIKIREKAVG